jgi:serine/threonine-protein kinase HipA
MPHAAALSVWMNGEHVGRWAFSAATHEFSYEESWFASSGRRPISLSMPLHPGQTYKGAQVETFFENLLPDNRQIRERLQRRFQTPSTRAFDLLAEIGRDCVGALQLLPEGDKPRNVRQIKGEPLTDAEVERVLSATLSSAPLGQREDDANDFRISLAGAQEKTALLWHDGRWHKPLGTTPTTHIVKLPIGMGHTGIDLTTSVENEWLCSEIVRAYDIDIAHCSIQHFGQYKVLVVERFDRRLADDSSWWIRLPQEDLCQATGTPPALKYESDGGPGIRGIMNLLLGSAQSAADRRDFLRTQLVFWLLCAIDGHAKNFSLFLLPQGNYRLTPRYDVLSAYPVLGHGAGKLHPKKVKMAMAAEGTSRHYHWEKILRRHWVETARRCGMQDEVESIIEEIVAATPRALAAVGGDIPKGFPPAVADSILSGVEAAARRLGDRKA